MAYQTILVHMCDEARADGLLDVAVAIARRHASHVVGIAALPPPVIATLGLPDSPAPVLMEDYRRAYINECERMRAQFQKRMGQEGIDAEWLIEDAWATSVGEKVLELACAIDLIVASQSDRTAPGAEQLDIAERLIIESGRPVVVVPRIGRHAVVGRRVLIAWNGRREAVRAVFDALPLLRLAEDVRIVSIQADGEGAEAADLTDRIVAALRRHGVSCETARHVRGSDSVGAELLRCVAENSADLLVMGCYGHSRLREFVFGGATRHILKHMTVPVLMSH